MSGTGMEEGPGTHQQLCRGIKSAVSQELLQACSWIATLPVYFWKLVCLVFPLHRGGLITCQRSQSWWES